MTGHEKYEKNLPLFLYGDLEDTEKKQLEDHLKRCEECDQKLREIKVLHTRLEDKLSLEPSEEKLVTLRNELRIRLRAEQAAALNASWWRRLPDRLVPKGVAAQLAGATAILLFGIVIGRFAWGERVSSVPVSPERLVMANLPSTENVEPFITNIDLVEYEPTTGRVTVKYKHVSDVLVQGQIDDEPVRRILAHAIRRESHPGRRLTAVRAFGTRVFPDAEVEKALVYAVENDTVDGVRLKAAQVLKSLPISAEIKAVFIRVLRKDSNPAVRIEAVEALSKVAEGEEVVPILQEASKDDENEFIRLQASKELQRRVNPTFDAK